MVPPPRPRRGVGAGPAGEVGPGVEPRLPPGLRGGAHGGPALPVHGVRERPAHVPLPRRLARRRGHRAALRGGRHARVERRDAAPLVAGRGGEQARGWEELGRRGAAGGGRGGGGRGGGRGGRRRRGRAQGPSGSEVEEGLDAGLLRHPPRDAGAQLVLYSLVSVQTFFLSDLGVLFKPWSTCQVKMYITM